MHPFKAVPVAKPQTPEIETGFKVCIPEPWEDDADMSVGFFELAAVMSLPEYQAPESKAEPSRNMRKLTSRVQCSAAALGAVPYMGDPDKTQIYLLQALLAGLPNFALQNPLQEHVHNGVFGRILYLTNVIDICASIHDSYTRKKRIAVHPKCTYRIHTHLQP